MLQIHFICQTNIKIGRELMHSQPNFVPLQNKNVF